MVASVAGILEGGQMSRTRPFRHPHHSASMAALVGGGLKVRPGEVSLAHLGVLFLDELPEFTRQVLDVMREPIENGEITISRAGRQADFPARVQLVAAMNPCPCGYHGDKRQPCRCSAEQINRYQSRVSGPLLDRIDIHVSVQRIDYAELRGTSPAGEPSEAVATRVQHAHRRQLERNGCSNARMDNRQVNAACTLDETQHIWLEKALQKLNMSARAIHRTLKVARTIADLADVDEIETAHLAEALGYRPSQVG